MTPVDGGVVDSVSTWSPGGDNRRTVSGVWTGGRFTGATSMLVQQFRAGDLVGLWHATGALVQTPSTPSESAAAGTTALQLAPRASDRGPEILRGDVLVFGEGRSATFNATAPIPVTRPLALHTPAHEHHAVLLPGAERNLVVFHRDLESMPAENPTIFMHRERRLDLRIAEFDRLTSASLEVVFEAATIALGRMTSVLPLVRDFILDAADELLFRDTRAPRGGRRHEMTYALYEPQFEAQPGSIRLILRPPTRDQIPLNALPDEVLSLLFESLRFAEAGDEQGLLNLLSARVLSVKTQLSRLQKIAGSAAINGDFLLRSSTSAEPVRVNARAFSTLRGAQRASAPRTLDRTGLVYAMDSLRFWCRLLSDSGEDWTLRYEPALGDEMLAVFQKRASLRFMTSSTLEKPRGHGTIMQLLPLLS